MYFCILFFLQLFSNIPNTKDITNVGKYGNAP